MSKREALRALSQAFGTLNQAWKRAKDERIREKLFTLESQVMELDERFHKAIGSSDSKAFRIVRDQLQGIQVELENELIKGGVFDELDGSSGEDTRSP
ncbi:hypothetical protein [Staphylospora marina]|uniref:hypothetical protein n=1 Tax=Staphylospora marina TaxID=2490858 RepID=UPI000F5BA2B8|nr:hypothetical protein [Staphylospora marina]